MKKVLIMAGMLTAIWSSGMAQSCDTLNNLKSPLDTATVYAADATDSAGYLSGNNEYGDLAKAEAFGVADSGYSVTSAIFHFGVVTINPTDSNTTVTLAVWDNAGLSLTGNSAPGNVLDSVQVTLGQIAQAVGAGQGLQVFFTGGVTVTTDTIYVGVLLPFITGDTLALQTNSYPAGPDGNGWEYANNPNGSGPIWGTYNNDWQLGGGSLGNYITATICPAGSGSAPTATFTAFDTVPLTCSPTTYIFSDSTVPTPVSVVWSFGDGTYSNDLNTSHVYTAGGSYTVTESVTIDTNSLVQVLAAATATLHVISSPVATATVIAPTDDTTGTGGAYISVTGGSGHYFTSWSDGTLGDTVTGAAAGSVYTVTVTDQNGCVTTDTVSIGFPTGILQISAAQKIEVYPNPATDVLNLVWSQKSNAEIAVVDMTGNVISTMITNGETKTAYNISSLAAGTYILRVTDSKSHQQHSMTFSKF